MDPTYPRHRIPAFLPFGIKASRVWIHHFRIPFLCLSILQNVKHTSSSSIQSRLGISHDILITQTPHEGRPSSSAPKQVWNQEPQDSQPCLLTTTLQSLLGGRERSSYYVHWANLHLPNVLVLQCSTAHT